MALWQTSSTRFKKVLGSILIYEVIEPFVLVATVQEYYLYLKPTAHFSDKILDFKEES